MTIMGLFKPFYTLGRALFFLSFLCHFVHAQDSGYDSLSDIYDFLSYSILPLVILLVYGPEKKPWFGTIIYYIDDLIIFTCLCALPLIMIKTSVPSMDLQSLIGLFSFNVVLSVFFWISVICGENDSEGRVPSTSISCLLLIFYNATWWTTFGMVSIRSYYTLLGLVILLTVVPFFFFLVAFCSAASRPNNPKCTRRLNIAALTNFSALIVYQSLWFNICFPLTAWITKLIFGLTLLAVGRLLFYLSNEESGDAGFFNCLKKGVVEFELDKVKEIDNAAYEIEKETDKAIMRVLKEKYNDYEKDLLKLIKEGYEAADKMQVGRKEVIKKIQEERVKAVDRILKEIIRGKDVNFLPKTSKVEKAIDDRLKKEKDDADKEIKKEKDDALNEIKEKAGVEIDTEKSDVVSSDV